MSHPTRLPQLLAAAVITASVAASAGCGHTLRRFPLAAPMLEDPDQQPFGPTPEEYFSPFAWDGLNQMVFRPVSRFLAVDPAGESINVNALDEIPNSSWFTNRRGEAPLTPELAADGPCSGIPPLDPDNGPWVVTGAKPNGANPGFIIKANGRSYLLKFDGLQQVPRATAADAIGTRIYWAAGYNTPCNNIIFFDRKVLEISPEATAEDDNGEDEPLTDVHLDAVFAKAHKLEDGRYRANSSLFVKGKPIGPWRYEGTRDDDPNDVVPHDDRREIRGAGVLASWVNHFDSREQNTLDTFVKVDGDRGYVKHYYIDFGDCFGSLWDWDALSRRWGHSYFVDFEHIAADFFSLGMIVRPWDEAEYGVSGDVFGYYNVEPFDPGGWHNEYPNPAFLRMQDRDAAWMARIIARFTDEHIEAFVSAGRFKRQVLVDELVRILKGRRETLLRHWFAELSPLADAILHEEETGSTLCLEDLAVTGGVADAKTRTYVANAWQGLELTEHLGLRVTVPTDGHVCVPLPATEHASETNPTYLIVDVTSASGAERQYPARVHLYQVAPKSFRVVGLERPDWRDPPSD